MLLQVESTCHLIGDILVLVAVLAWAIGTVLLKPMAIKYGAFRVTGLALTFGSIIYFPFGITRVISTSLSDISMIGWLSIVYMAAMVSIVAYFLWYWVLKYLEVSRIAILHNIQPIIATIVAYYLLSEPITGSFVLGGVIVIGGVILTEI